MSAALHWHLPCWRVIIVVVMFFDTHCHIVDTLQDGDSKADGPSEALPDSLHALVLMSTKPEDWPLVANLVASESGQRYMPAFGIHPWKAERYLSAGTLATEQLERDVKAMEAALREHPTALVGEIGLDHSERILGKDEPRAQELARLQSLLFETQWDMACRLARPVSIHCVRSDALFFDFLGKKQRQNASHDRNVSPALCFPPSFVLHSYTGSGESVKRFFSLSLPSQIYFSLSKVISGRLPDKKLARLIELVPEDRVLIESDETDLSSLEASLRWSCELVARVKGWTMEDTMQRLVRNACRFTKA